MHTLHINVAIHSLAYKTNAKIWYNNTCREEDAKNWIKTLIWKVCILFVNVTQLYHNARYKKTKEVTEWLENWGE